MFQPRHIITKVLATVMGACAMVVAAQDFPARPITIVAPFPAGSVTDNVTRVIAQSLQQSLGQSVVVDNRPGAQGTVGAAYVANAKPDGYTLLMGSSVMFVAKQLIKSLAYDPVQSFTPVSGVGSTAMMFMVNETSPIKSVAELAKVAVQAQPPVTMGYGSPSGQVAAALFGTVTHSQPVPVSYRGIPQAMTDLVGGHVQVAIVDISTGLAQVNARKARALAISAATRYSGAPEIPTLQESFPQAAGTLETIIAVMAPAGTPTAVVQRLDRAIQDALARSETQARFQALNTAVLPLNAEQLTRRIASDNPNWELLMKKAGIEPQ